MDLAFHTPEREFRRDRTLADGYLASSVYAAKAKCDHADPNFFNQTKEVQQAVFHADRT
jgi:hypothetical protein